MIRYYCLIIYNWIMCWKKRKRISIKSNGSFILPSEYSKTSNNLTFWKCWDSFGFLYGRKCLKYNSTYSFSTYYVSGAILSFYCHQDK